MATEYLYDPVSKLVNITEEPEHTSEVKPITIRSPASTFSGTLQWRNFKPYVEGYNPSTGDYHELRATAKKPTVKALITCFLLAQCAYLVDPRRYEDSTRTVFLQNGALGYDMSKRYWLIKGKVQSGKTRFIITQALMNFYSGLSSVIALRNQTEDVRQIEGRLSKLIKKCVSNVREHHPEYQQPPVFSYNPKDLGNGSPCIVIVLCNITQISNVFNVIQDNNMSGNVSLLIDEADATDTRKNSVQVAQKLVTMKQHMHTIYGISATVMDIIFQQKPEICNVITLPTPPHYKDIDSVQFKELESVIAQEDDHHLLKKDPYLAPFLRKFVTFEPVYDHVFNDTHPVMYLLRSVHTIAEMFALQDYCREHFPKVTTIVSNCEGLSLWSSKINTPSITVKLQQGNDDSDLYKILKKGKNISQKEVVIEADMQNCYKTKQISISNMISYLKDNGGVNTFGHILIIADRTASRGISFTSDDYGDCFEENKLGWHIIGQYLIPATSMRGPDIVQAARVLCVCKDSITLRWYTPAVYKDEILKAFNTPEKLIKGGMDVTSGLTLDKAIETVPINRNELPKKFKLLKNTKQQPNYNVIVIDDDEAGSNAQRGQILHILEKTLKPRSNSVSGKVYDEIVKTFTDEANGFGLGRWVSKTSVLQRLVTSGRKLITLQSLTHPWHDVNKAPTHYRPVDSENGLTGLFFRQREGHANSEWEMCYLE